MARVGKGVVAGKSLKGEISYHQKLTTIIGF